MSEDDDLATARARPLTQRCKDCAVEIIESNDAHCRSCSETRRLLPRFLCLTSGRAHVRALLAEQEALDKAIAAPG
jgi:hypothetical protein